MSKLGTQMSFSHIKIGKKFPESVNVVIEIPKGSSNKYEYSEELDCIQLDRVLHSPFFYPTDYGFIPETRSEDGDHLDILVLIKHPTFSGCVLQARPVGVLDLEDEKGRDWKIIAVAENDPYYNGVHDIDQVNLHLKNEIQHFFETYKHLEKGKKTIVRAWHPKAKAFEIIKEEHKSFISAKSKG